MKVERNEDGYVKNQEWLRRLIALLFVGSSSTVTYASISRVPEWAARSAQTLLLDIMVDKGQVAERRQWTLAWKNLWPIATRICALRKGDDRWHC